MQLKPLCSCHSSFRCSILQSWLLSVARFPCWGWLVHGRGYRTVNHIKDERVAEQVMKLVRVNQVNKSSILLLANQGSNSNITKAALKTGFPEIIFTEKDGPALQQHLEIAQQFQVCRFQGNLLNCFEWTFQGHESEAHLQQEMSILGRVEQKLWTDDPPLTVFGIITPGSMLGIFFLKYLVSQLMNLRSLYTKGRVDWFLFISPTNYKQLVKGKLEHSSHNYRALSVMMNLLYDWKVLLKLPAASFDPPYVDLRFKKVEDQLGSTVIKKDEVVLVQMTPKADLFQDQVMQTDEIHACYSFLEQLLANKKRRLIPRMEEMVPGCGLKLIEMGYTMVTIIKEIRSPEEMVHLFKVLQNLPEYKGSPLELLSLHSEELEIEPEDLSSESR